MKNIQDGLFAVIGNCLREFDIPESERLKLSGCIELDAPSAPGFGDLSTNLGLRLSKRLQKAPQEISQALTKRIIEKINASPLQPFVKEVKVEGAGFINFYLSDAYFQQQLKEMLLRGKRYLKQDFGRKRAVLIEFVSANPTGPLSIAHARQAAVGDILGNLLAFLGCKVKREYYLNDEGNQVDTLAKSIELRMKELSGEKIAFPDTYYQGDYIYDIAAKLKDKEIDLKSMLEFGISEILDTIKKDLKDFGVTFDYWRSQKKLAKSGKIKKALDFLKRKGFIYEQDGATWFQSTRFSDDKDRVVVKSDGSYTYLAPDIAYHQEKYSRGFSWLINLWGPDHHGYIGRLKAAVEALGEDPNTLSIIIVQLATLFKDGKPLQMSTRRAQYITLAELLDEVGSDAGRFFFLMRRTSSHLDFDLDVAKKETSENPVYYVQYAHARICGILRNYAKKINARNIDVTLLKEKEELTLIKKLWQFLGVLRICYKTLEPSLITVYLQELAQEFHKFYDARRVLGQDERLTQARIALIEATRIFIATGLEILGISKPERM